MILSIQYLRAIAALLVVLSHVAWKNIQAGHTTMSWWHEAGTFGVDIFFIISGFIMVYITQKMHQKPHTVRTFIKKRFVRIIPLYWFYTLIALAIFIVLPERLNSSGGDTDVLKSFFLLPLVEHQKYLVNVGWTLHYEFTFYILFSFGLLLTRKAGNLLVAGIILLSVGYSSFFPIESIHYTVRTIFSSLFLEFVLGMLLFHIINNIKRIHPFYSISFIILGVLQFYSLHSGGSFTGIHGIDKGLSAFLICFGVISLEYFWVKKEVKLLSKLGDASYSLYLVHPFVLVAVVMVNEKLQNILPQNEIFFLSLMTIVSLISGYLSHIWIEKNLIKLTKKVFK